MSAGTALSAEWIRCVRPIGLLDGRFRFQVATMISLIVGKHCKDRPSTSGPLLRIEPSLSLGDRHAVVIGPVPRRCLGVEGLPGSPVRS